MHLFRQIFYILYLVFLSHINKEEKNTTFSKIAVPFEPLIQLISYIRRD